ncbi:hypothetical protein R1sor_023751 [Riccia sorocarpa]|uniref:Thioredoxin domain-containing protein n=1 Tax=Riccia sorocarpa TaxID=122646 RepID=A0ABD3GRR6_9MARC
MAAQCQAQSAAKKISPSRFDLYGDIFSAHLYGSSATTNGNNNITDRLQKYSTDYNERRMSSRDTHLANVGFREEGRRPAAVAPCKLEAPATPTSRGSPATPTTRVPPYADSGYRDYHYHQQQQQQQGNGDPNWDRRNSNGVCASPSRAGAGKAGAGAEMGAYLHHYHTKEVAQAAAAAAAVAAAEAAATAVKNVLANSRSPQSPQPRESSNFPSTPVTPSSGIGRFRHSGELSTPPSGRSRHSGEQTTPPSSGGRSSSNRSGEFDRNNTRAAAGAQPMDPGFAYGEILKGVGNLNSYDEGHHPSGRVSSDGRGGRAESPKSCSSSSAGSSSGGSPTVGRRIVNFGNILPSGGSLKLGSSSPVPHPGLARSNGGMGQSRRSNSADFPSGTLKKMYAAGRSGYDGGGNGVYTGVGLNPKGSMSNTTSPTNSVGTVSPSPHYTDSFSSNAAAASAAASGAKFAAAAAVDHQVMKSAGSSADAEELKNAGNEKYKKGHFSEALALYDKAIALAPEKAAYRSNRAAALTGLGRLPEAVQECLHAVRLDVNYTRAHHRLACLYLRLGQIDNARKYFKSAGPQADWEDTQRMMVIEKHLLRCNQARKMQDWHALVRVADAAIIAGADSAPQILAYKSEALLKLHRPEEADEVFANVRKVEEVLKRQSFSAINVVVLVIQAEIDMALGRFEAAVLSAERASQLASNDLEVSAVRKKARAVAAARKLGNDLFKAGRYVEAVTAYGEGLEADMENAVLLCNRATCRAKLGQWEKAVEDCNAALEVHPTYIKALLRRAQSYFMLERLDDALRDYEVLRMELPGDVEVRRGLFDVQVALKKSKGEDTFKLRFGGDVENVTTNEQFQEAVTSPGVAIVEFSTRWSERCKLIAPFVDNLCKRYLSLNFLKVDVDDLPYLAKVENVNSVPTFKVYRNGSKVLELIGPNEQALERAVIHYSL